MAVATVPMSMTSGQPAEDPNEAFGSLAEARDFLDAYLGPNRDDSLIHLEHLLAAAWEIVSAEPAKDSRTKALDYLLDEARNHVDEAKAQLERAAAAQMVLAHDDPAVLSPSAVRRAKFGDGKAFAS